jgi:hypothetical protein
VQARPAVAEVLERQGLQGHAVRLALPGEGLDDAIRPDLVEATVKAVLLQRIPLAPVVDEAPAPAGAGVPVLDAGADVGRADPAGVDLGIGVRPEQLGGRGLEIPGHADQGNLRVGLDPGGGQVLGRGHGCSPCSVG